MGWHFAAISRLIRLAGFLFAISVVPAYIALITYHREMLPAPLLFSISAAREGVPFPTLLEGIGLLIAFEILREAGERTPAGFGQTLSIVGGLCWARRQWKPGLSALPWSSWWPFPASPA